MAKDCPSDSRAKCQSLISFFYCTNASFNKVNHFTEYSKLQSVADVTWAVFLQNDCLFAKRFIEFFCKFNICFVCLFCLCDFYEWDKVWWVVRMTANTSFRMYSMFCNLSKRKT